MPSLSVFGCANRRCSVVILIFVGFGLNFRYILPPAFEFSLPSATTATTGQDSQAGMPSTSFAQLSQLGMSAGQHPPSAESLDLSDAAARARHRWEQHFQQPFPGRQWGIEPHCGHVRDDVDGRPRTGRNDWVTEVLHRVKGSTLLPKLYGVEVGACQLPVQFPPAVKMRYVDMAADEATLKSQCFLKDDARKPDIVDDATVLANVKDESFDLLLAAHVLEHMPDAIGALRHWLRVVRPGGLVFVVVPDLCAREFAFGDRFRMVAGHAHFIGEFMNPEVSQRNFAGHASEQGLTVAGVNALREMSGLPPLGPIKSWFMKSMPPREGITEQLVVPLTLTPDNISDAEELAINNPHNVHLHLWTPVSMRKMLKAASPLIEPLGVRFDIDDIHVAGATEFNMQELRMALRRL